MTKRKGGTRGNWECAFTDEGRECGVTDKLGVSVGRSGSLAAPQRGPLAHSQGRGAYSGHRAILTRVRQRLSQRGPFLPHAYSRLAAGKFDTGLDTRQ
jgi:hypothetical protein